MWNLHKRIALFVLTRVGARPRYLLAGFMGTTSFISMWMSNVATTAMMTPIAQAVLVQLKDVASGSVENSEEANGIDETSVDDESKQNHPETEPLKEKANSSERIEIQDC